MRSRRPHSAIFIALSPPPAGIAPRGGEMAAIPFGRLLRMTGSRKYPPVVTSGNPTPAGSQSPPATSENTETGTGDVPAKRCRSWQGPTARCRHRTRLPVRQQSTKMRCCPAERPRSCRPSSSYTTSRTRSTEDEERSPIIRQPLVLDLLPWTRGMINQGLSPWSAGVDTDRPQVKDQVSPRGSGRVFLLSGCCSVGCRRSSWPGGGSRRLRGCRVGGRRR